MGALFAIDVGGSRIKSSIVADGQVQRLAVQDMVKGDATHHLRQIENLWKRQGQGSAIGICWPGKLNSGCSLRDLSQAVQDSKLPIKILTDDMIAAVHGEARNRNIALLQIGTGVGAAMIRNGQAHKCIAGHIVFRDHGLADDSGMHGAVDAYLGWGSISRRLQNLEEPLRPADPAELLRLAETNPAAEEILEDALAAAGFVSSYLMACAGCHQLVLAGGVAAAWGDVLKTSIEEALAARLYPDFAVKLQVELSADREHAPLLGLWEMHEQSS